MELSRCQQQELLQSRLDGLIDDMQRMGFEFMSIWVDPETNTFTEVRIVDEVREKEEDA